MPLFVVERFLPGMTPEALAALVRDQQGLGGVAYLHSTYVPADETCFCLVEAGSEQEVKEANTRARLPFERVVEAMHVLAGASGVTGHEVIATDEAMPATDRRLS